MKNKQTNKQTTGNEAMDIYENVLAHEEEEDLDFPNDSNFTIETKSLIKKLLHPKKTRRLGKSC